MPPNKGPRAEKMDRPLSKALDERGGGQSRFQERKDPGDPWRGQVAVKVLGTSADVEAGRQKGNGGEV